MYDTDTIDGQYMARARTAHDEFDRLPMEEQDMLHMGMTPERMKPQQQETQPEAYKPQFVDESILREGLFPDLAKGARSGIYRGFKNTLQAFSDLAAVPDWSNPESGEMISVDVGEVAEAAGMPTPERPESVGGQLVEGVAQFLTAFIPAAKAVQGARFGAMVAGGAADFFAFDEHEERLSNLVQSTPLANPLTEFLAADGEDSAALGRFKNVAEGMLAGELVDGMVKSVRALKQARKFRTAMGMSVENVAEGGFKPGSSGEVQTVKIEYSPGSAVPAPKDLPTPKRMAGNINLDYIDGREGFDSLLSQVAETFGDEIDAARRGTITTDQTKQLARELGMTEETLLKRRSGEAYNAEQLLAARWILWKSADETVQVGEQLAEAVSKGQATDELRAMYRLRLQRHTALQAQVAGATAEVGRAQRQMQIVAAREEASGMRLQQINDIINASGGGSNIDDMAAEMLAKLKQANNGELDMSQVNAFIKGAQRASTKDVLYEVWINALLSGPQTHATNILSNALVQMWMAPERALAAGVSKLPVIGSGEIGMREVAADIYGMIEGFTDGLRIIGKGAGDIINFRPYDGVDVVGKTETRYHPSLTADFFNLESGGIMARAVDMLGEFVRTPGKALQVGDDFFKTIGYRRELRARAHRQASAEGLSGAEHTARVNEIIANPPEDIQLAAIDLSRYATFTQSLEGGMKKFQQFANDYAVTRVVIPFIRTPYNIMKFALERTPAAPVFKSVRADIAAGGARRDTAIARMALGSMTMAAVGKFAQAGVITGGGPGDGTEKSLMYDTGWQPYSIKVGDRYYSYSRMEPIGSLFGMAADAVEIMERTDDPEEREKIAATIVAAFAKNVTSKTFLRGVSEAIEVLQDPERYGDQYVSRLVGTAVPTGVAQVNRAFFDKTMRDTQGWLDQIKSRTPGLSKSIPPRTDVWGNPITFSGSAGPDILSPIYSSEEERATASRELLRLGYSMSKPMRTQRIGGVDVPLDQAEYYRFMQLYGQDAKDPNTGIGFEETVEALANGEHPYAASYQQLSDGPEGGKVDMIRNLRSMFMELAKQQIVQERPDLAQHIEEQRYEQQQNLMPRF